MSIFLITFGFLLVAILLMSLGVIFQKKAIKGTCGGLNDPEISCDFCKAGVENPLCENKSEEN